MAAAARQDIEMHVSSYWIMYTCKKDNANFDYCTMYLYDDGI